MIKKELKKKIEEEVLFRELNSDEILIIDSCSDIIKRYVNDINDLEREIYGLNVRLKNKNIEIESLKQELKDERNKRQ